jgi:Glycosyltransferase WbsX
MLPSKPVKPLLDIPDERVTVALDEPRSAAAVVASARVAVTNSFVDLLNPPDWRGCVDTYTDGLITGWAAMTSNFLAPVNLEIRVLGQVVGHVRTQEPRPDISESLGFPVKCGFHFSLGDLPDATVKLLEDRLKAFKDAQPLICDLVEVWLSDIQTPLPTIEEFRKEPANIELLLRKAALNANHVYQNEIVSIRDRLLDTANFVDADGTDVKVLANYLPQFHPFAENNDWWGEGFTEWTNVVTAKKYLPGHQQPRLPADLGFYDLRLDSVHEQQIEMAKQYGVTGFIYYYYWFSGKTLMTMPVDRHLDKNYELDFCLCWANESWSRRWDGSESDVLMAQRHIEADDEAFIQACLKYFASERYIKIDGAPLLQVYRISLMANPQATLARWRAVVKEAGYPDLHISMCETFGDLNPSVYGCDSSSQFPPHGVTATRQNDKYTELASSYTGVVYDYAEVVQNEIARPRANHIQFRGAMPSWDNTSRKGAAGNIFHGATPALFQTWLTHLVTEARANLPQNMRFVLINAWNEWAEGAHLEPDRENGRANLDAVRNALAPEHKALTALAAAADGTDPLSGTRRYVEGLVNSNHQMRAILQRAYINLAPPQGSLIPVDDDLFELIPTEKTAAVYIDSIQNLSKPYSKLLIQDYDTPLLAQGWIKLDAVDFRWSLPIFVTLRAVDPARDKPARYAALITDKVFREDVRDLLKHHDDECWCGFQCNFWLAKVPPGRYQLEFLVGDTSGLNRAFVVSDATQMVLG